MLSELEKHDEVERGTVRARWTAWVARATLALVPVAVLAATGLHMLQQREEQLQERMGAQFRRFQEEYSRAPLSLGIQRAIDEGIEDAFAPVYDEIPELLDWHYSFLGSYTELTLALLGKLEEEVELRLFEGLEERVDVAAAEAGRVMQGEMLAELQRWFDRDVASLPPETRPRYENKLEPLLEDARNRLTVSMGPTVLVAAMAGWRTSVAVQVLAANVAQKLGAGVAIRAGGAIVGRWAALVVAGVAAVGVDIAIRELDELLNREDLEQALATQVDELKEQVKSQLSSAVENGKGEALGDVTPMELR